MTAEDVLTRKLSLVQRIYQKNRVLLSKDRELKRLLEAHAQAFEAGQKLMDETGAALFCARCGEAGRSCCGADMELHCDDALLVANLLVGVTFPSRRFDPKGCFFLGPKGCVLRLRPLIFRNFICPELSEFLGLERTALLQQALENEARLLFIVTDRLKAFFQKAL